MKTLLINAHPQPHLPTFSHNLQTHFIEKWQALNPTETLNILNLAETEVPRLDDATLTLFQKQASGETLTAEENRIDTVMKRLLAQFKAHPRIVIVMPLHNFNIPSKLKDYMDNILIARETFKYITGGSVGLMTDNRKVLCCSPAARFIPITTATHR